MKKNESITKIMSTNITTVHQGQKLSDVRHIICESNIHHIPVVDGKILIGLISFTDLMKLNIVISGADERTIDSIVDQQFTIQDVMTTKLMTLKNTDTVRQASKILAESNFHSLPVVNEQKEIVGIVTMSDLIKYLNDQY
ncbi:MAG: CBS domain-containing protein [Methylococcaceae bacterium]|nr:CBS domain-containing protein [Methylococcaceae bacterium]